MTSIAGHYAAAAAMPSSLGGYVASRDRCLRARVILWARLMRRVEAWERAEEWAAFRVRWADRSLPIDPHACDVEYWLVQNCDSVTAIPWRPLWLDAPPHDGTTPAQRRARR